MGIYFAGDLFGSFKTATGLFCFISKRVIGKFILLGVWIRRKKMKYKRTGMPCAAALLRTVWYLSGLFLWQRGSSVFCDTSLHAQAKQLNLAQEARRCFWNSLIFPRPYGNCQPEQNTDSIISYSAEDSSLNSVHFSLYQIDLRTGRPIASLETS